MAKSPINSKERKLSPIDRITRSLILLSFCVAGFSPVFAAKAHVHGAGELVIAVESMKLTFVLDSPTESIWGYETEKPRTVKERKAHRNAMKLLKERVHKVFLLDEKLGCEFKNTKLKVTKEEVEEMHGDHSHGTAEHRSLQAEWVAICKKSVAGSLLRINFRKHLPRLKKVKVMTLGETGQSSVTLTHGHGEVKL